MKPPLMVGITPIHEGYCPAWVDRVTAPIFDALLRLLKRRLVARWNRDREAADEADAEVVALRVYGWARRLQFEVLRRQFLMEGDRADVLAAMRGLVEFVSFPPRPVTAGLEERMRAIRRVAIVRPGVEPAEFEDVILKAIV